MAWPVRLLNGFSWHSMKVKFLGIFTIFSFGNKRLFFLLLANVATEGGCWVEGVRVDTLDTDTQFWQYIMKLRREKMRKKYTDNA